MIGSIRVPFFQITALPIVYAAGTRHATSLRENKNPLLDLIGLHYMPYGLSSLQLPSGILFQLFPSSINYMFQYRRYNIRNTDQFRPDDFPKIMDELSEINNGIAGLPGVHKGDIIVSFLKDQSIKTDWLNANPALAGLITSRHFETTHLESLFESCRINNQFTEEMEVYIRKYMS
jgi:hypothetical protein